MELTFNLLNEDALISTPITITVNSYYRNNVITSTATMNTSDSIDVLVTTLDYKDIVLNILYDTATLILSADYLFPTDYINLDLTVDTGIGDPIQLKFNLPDIIQEGDLVFTYSPTSLTCDNLLATLAIQDLMSNTIRYYKTNNFKPDSVTVEILKYGTSIHSFSSPTGIFNIDSNYSIFVTYTDINGDTEENTYDYVYNKFIPEISTTYSINDYLVENLPTVNTVHSISLLADYNLIKSLPQTYKIQHTNISSFEILNIDNSLAYREDKFNNIDSVTTSLADFTPISNLSTKDYIFKLSNYIVKGILNKDNNISLLEVGKYYYVLATGTSSSIDNTLGNISITLNDTIYISTTYGFIGSTVLFDVNDVELLEVKQSADLLLHTPYMVVDGSITIDGTTYSSNSIIILNNFTYTSTSLKCIEIEIEEHYSKSYNVSILNDIEILNLKCGEYTIINNTILPVTVNVYKLVYNVGKVSTWDLIKELNLSSTEYDNSFYEDGVYKVTFNNKVYYFVNICTINNCMLKYITDIVCSCNCNTDNCNCNYDDHYKFVSGSIMVSILKDMIDYLFGPNVVYKNIQGEEFSKLFSIQELITRLSNYCNNC